MNPLPNAFSLYDFLGYLIPGGIFLVGFHLIPLPCFYEMHYFQAFSCLCSAQWTESLSSIAVFLTFGYMTGHALSYVSSMTVEKYSVWTIGYPSKYLLEENIRPSWKAGTKLYFADYFFPSFVKFQSGLNIQRWQIFVQRLIVFLIMIPYVFPILVLVFLIGLNESIRKVLPYDFAILIQSRTQLFIRQQKKYGETYDLTSGESFRFLYHYTLERFNVHVVKMQNYVALYGFCRTISLINVLFFWWFSYTQRSCIWSLKYFLALVILSGLSSLFYLAFNKFFRKFSLECYMAIVTNLEY